MEALLRLEKVGKEYGNNGTMTEVLKDVNFVVYPREIVSLVGPSGCGKTTLLKLLSNVVLPTRGKVYYNNDDISYARRQGLIGMVFQSANLMSNRTVEQNIRLPLEIRNMKNYDKVGEMIDLVGLDGFKDFYPCQLSGGMKQRVSIARALVYDPPLLLMDEPFSSLDEMMREQLNAELLRIHDNLRQTIVFVTHDIEEAVFISDRIISISAADKALSVIDINLPKERNLGLKTKECFFREIIRVREQIQEYA